MKQIAREESAQRRICELRAAELRVVQMQVVTQRMEPRRRQIDIDRMRWFQMRESVDWSIANLRGFPEATLKCC